MTTAEYGVIRRWVRYWEKDLLKEPKELVLGSEYLINILPEALSSLEDWHKRYSTKKLQKGSKKDWEWKLAELLERAVKEDPVVDLVALEYPTEIKELKKLLSAGAYDVGLICPILRKVKEAPSSQTLKDMLLRELSRGDQADLSALGAVSVVVARRGIGKFHDRELRDLLERALAREGTSALLQEHLEEIKTDVELEERARVVARELLLKAADSREVAEGLSVEAEEFFDLFGGDLGWRHLVYLMLDDLRRAWTAVLEERRAGADGSRDASATVSALLKDEEAVAELGTDVIRSYAETIFRRALQEVDSETIRDSEPQVTEAGRRLAAFLGTKGVFHDPESPGEYEGALYPATHRALHAASKAIDVATSGALAEEYVAKYAEFVSDLASEIGRRMTEMLVDEAHSSTSGGAEATTVEDSDVGKQVKTLCFDWAARTTVHAELGRLLAPLNARLLGYMEEMTNSEREDELPLGERFWDLFARYFSRETTKPMYVPWQNMDEAHLRRVVDGLFDCFEGVEKEHLAIFGVKNLNPRGLRWRMGSIEFYDPSVYDHGEGRWFREHTSERGPFTHAAVRVTAGTRVEARRRARRLLEEGLSCLSFGLSVYQKRSGFRPEVVDEAFVFDPSVAGFRFGGEPGPDVGHTEHYADVSDVSRRARAYDHLLTLSAREEPLNELQESFLKAIRWYREARWEEDPAKRFALYWIGLEHIFAGGQQEKGKNIYADLPDLQITWRTLGRALLPLSWSNREVGNRIEGDDELEALVDGHPELKDWRSDERVLLDPEKVKLLIDLTPQDKVDAKKLFQDYRDQLLEIASYSGDISDDVGRLRDRQWFKLYLLYALRNAMFHEAVYEDERLPYLADEIGDVADGVLPKVVEEATSPAPECATIKQLIERFGQQPWGA